MGLPNGVHHIAICTKDIKGQIDFYSQVVGMELIALYWMHGVQKTFHGFLKMGNASIAFVQSPEIGEIQPMIGVSHPSWTAAPVAAGVMQHLALNVDSEAELLAIRDRVRSHGYWVMGPIDHGFCKSIYLAAPEGSCSNSPPPRVSRSTRKRGSILKWSSSPVSLRPTSSVIRTRR